MPTMSKTYTHPCWSRVVTIVFVAMDLHWVTPLLASVGTNPYTAAFTYRDLVVFASTLGIAVEEVCKDYIRR